MGVANSPDIFQQKMNDLFHGFEFICAYIYKILILTKVYWTDHVQKIELTLNKLKGKGLICNIEKSFFRQSEMEYLCFGVICDSAKPINRNIEAITNMKPNNSLKEVLNFIGIINYYRDMWPSQSHTLAHLTRLTSNRRKSQCTQVKQYAFEKIERIVARDTLLTYPDFN